MQAGKLSPRDTVSVKRVWRKYMIRIPPMTDFIQARKNMIDCQLATMGIIDPDLLAVLGDMPREQFVPSDKKALAYTDEDLQLGSGQFLMEPLVFARLIQAAVIQQNDKALVLADPTGYAAAVVSRLAGTAVVPSNGNAVAVWSELGCGNIIQDDGSAARGCAGHAPYNVIIVNGSVSAAPQALLDQLAPDGRLLTVLRKPGAPVGKAVLMARAGAAYSSKILFDAGTPFVPELAPKTEFVF